MASEASEACGAVAPAEGPAAEFEELLPPEAEFEVNYSSAAGRFMVSNVPLVKGSEFLIETPLVAWPLVPELSGSDGDCNGPSDGVPVRALWCEGCLSCLGGPQDDGAQAEPAAAGESAKLEGSPGQTSRRVRRRITWKRPSTACELLDDRSASPSASSGAGPLRGLYCPSCWERLGAQREFFTPELLWRWRRWQAHRSANSCVGLEAFARCFAMVASTAATLRETHGADPMTAINAAMEPFDRLAGPPPGGGVTLHGTEAGEVAEELKASEPFWGALQRAVGCPAAAAALLSEASVDGLAGRLVLNSAGIQALGSGPDGSPLRAAGVFVLLSTMNHSCAPTAEAVFSDSSTVTLRTTRDVSAGDALTLAYVPTELSVEERRAKLRHWFFECDCWRCEAEACVAAALAQ